MEVFNGSRDSPAAHAEFRGVELIFAVAYDYVTVDVAASVCCEVHLLPQDAQHPLKVFYDGVALALVLEGVLLRSRNGVLVCVVGFSEARVLSFAHKPLHIGRNQQSLHELPRVSHVEEIPPRQLISHPDDFSFFIEIHVVETSRGDVKIRVPSFPDSFEDFPSKLLKSGENFFWIIGKPFPRSRLLNRLGFRHLPQPPSR